MERTLEDILPIMGVEHDCILSKQGDITVAFEVTLPEIFTLSEEDYEAVHQALIKAIRVLPKQCIFHKQDWYTQDRYKSQANGGGFLADSSQRYFNGRSYLHHSCFIYLTKKPANRRAVTSMYSGLLKKTIVPVETVQPQLLHDFLETVGQFERILKDSGFMQLRRLKDNELAGTKKQAGIIEKYCNLNTPGEVQVLRELSFAEEIRVGDLSCQIYSLADVQDLPAHCGARMTYDKYSTDRTRFPLGFAAPMGLLLFCNHIYNQFIFIEDAQVTLKKLESKRLRLQSLSAYSRENAISRDATNDFLNEAIGAQRMPVRAHFNIIAWSNDPVELKDLKNKVSSAMAQIDAVAKQEVSGAPQQFWACMPGNAGDFPSNDCFDTFAEQACCFLALETNYRSDPPKDGIRFCDRLNGRPVFLDMFDAPRKAGITSNMGMLVCGTSGGGKSMTVNHILHSLYEQGAHCVTVDIGGSYKGLCELVGGYYFTYEEKDPIKFNPFYLPPGDFMDSEKKESLKALLVTLWKQENESFNRSEYVALSNALSGYYDYLQSATNVFPCFNTFYEYLQTNYLEVLKGHNVKDRDFDVNNFLYVLRPYYKNGEFDFLLNATEKLDILNQPFCVFELDNCKDHPIIFPVVTLAITEMFISKMRKLAGKRKVLMIDEAWKAIAKSGMAEFLRYAFKTIRKFNGIPGVITQELDDLISSPIIKDAIINNADIKILMDMRKFMNKFDKLQDVLGLSEKAKTILLSVNKDNREIFIDLGGQVTKVYKNELCPEEYYAFTTDGKERVKVMEYAQQQGSVENGIRALIRDINNK
ncbi:TraG family conjugative transposon ATPase [Panacibacter ginsenosidivorans]|uniref:TraG family conjugative transposon ATPase n=1 Tax=Panacibacter ginsenosidivorans TaxID=1813871 RepID=A0A5B8VE57_9BACT|nr:TraG family conjugative transposon ATPase [Panacibacter ginsenosidivorans]QEC69281.1 TraG family conjugative transposon ATPase [Panacibacter ginsenosidivorans]